jgi:hypothetical protein
VESGESPSADWLGSLFAWYFKDLNLLLSSYITGDSRIAMRRTIQERVRTIAPFLRLDRDPYLVIAMGGCSGCRTPTPRVRISHTLSPAGLSG